MKNEGKEKYEKEGSRIKPCTAEKDKDETAVNRGMYSGKKRGKRRLGVKE